MHDNSTSHAGRPRLAAGHRLEGGATQPVLAAARGAVRISATAAAVLALCDGTRAPEAIAAATVGRFAGDRHEGLAADVRSFLEAARRRGWVETG
jgi:Coenzyme PQQ synthesis protein D (PqqD)